MTTFAIKQEPADTRRLADDAVLAALYDKLRPGQAAIQFGAGPLALGHNVQVLDACGVTILLASRVDQSRYPERLRRLEETLEVRKVIMTTDARHPPAHDPHGSAFSTRVAAFIDSSSAQAVDLVVHAVAAPEVRIIALALRTGLVDLAPTILAGLAQRNPGDRLTIVSCENTHPKNWEFFMAACREFANVEVVDSSVDRICLPATDPIRNGCEVFTEDFRLWTVERDRNGIIEQVLASEIDAGRVEVVPDVRPYRLAKKFLVNSLQLALALDAAESREPLLSRHLLRYDSGSDKSFPEQLLEELLQALALTIGAQFPALPPQFAGQRLFAHNPITRLSDFPDPVSRLLDVLRPERASEYRAVVEARLLEPMRILEGRLLRAPALRRATNLADALWDRGAWAELHGA